MALRPALRVLADQITVTVRPRFTDDFGNVFAPELPLTLTTELVPAAGASLHVEDSGTVPATIPAPRTLILADHEVTAGTARPAAVLSLVLALLLGGLAAVRSRLAPELAEAKLSVVATATCWSRSSRLPSHPDARWWTSPSAPRPPSSPNITDC